ncbi:hypothetical protein NEHOM01_0854 [Nematocida homosporus]|uniref:uncharacterized protein n=1 Tax=Nematocida homosporus TaxID=1912981 RepID=UPI00221EE298|nr:uncharacterized protein NEHOM01_0854 [Nematocida homosporus]KAI5185495.1 hypothetical protein NEHOM01_0854 [Nematocida homosporus]
MNIIKLVAQIIAPFVTVMNVTTPNHQQGLTSDNIKDLSHPQHLSASQIGIASTLADTNSPLLQANPLSSETPLPAQPALLSSASEQAVLSINRYIAQHLQTKQQDILKTQKAVAALSNQLHNFIAQYITQTQVLDNSLFSPIENYLTEYLETVISPWASEQTKKYNQALETAAAIETQQTISTLATLLSHTNSFTSSQQTQLSSILLKIATVLQNIHTFNLAQPTLFYNPFPDPHSATAQSVLSRTTQLRSLDLSSDLLKNHGQGLIYILATKQITTLTTLYYNTLNRHIARIKKPALDTINQIHSLRDHQDPKANSIIKEQLLQIAHGLVQEEQNLQLTNKKLIQYIAAFNSNDILATSLSSHPRSARQPRAADPPSNPSASSTITSNINKLLQEILKIESPEERSKHFMLLQTLIRDSNQALKQKATLTCNNTSPTSAPKTAIPQDRNNFSPYVYNTTIGYIKQLLTNHQEQHKKLVEQNVQLQAIQRNLNSTIESTKDDVQIHQTLLQQKKAINKQKAIQNEHTQHTADLHAHAAQAQNDITQQTAQLQDADKQNKELNSVTAKAIADLHKANDELKSLTANLTNVQDQIKANNNEQIAIQQDLLTLNSTLKRQVDDLNALHNTYHLLNATIEGYLPVLNSTAASPLVLTTILHDYSANPSQLSKQFQNFIQNPQSNLNPTVDELYQLYNNYLEAAKNNDQTKQDLDKETTKFHNCSAAADEIAAQVKHQTDLNAQAAKEYQNIDTVTTKQICQQAEEDEAALGQQADSQIHDITQQTDIINNAVDSIRDNLQNTYSAISTKYKRQQLNATDFALDMPSFSHPSPTTLQDPQAAQAFFQANLSPNKTPIQSRNDTVPNLANVVPNLAANIHRVLAEATNQTNRLTILQKKVDAKVLEYNSDTAKCKAYAQEVAQGNSQPGPPGNITKIFVGSQYTGEDSNTNDDFISRQKFDETH